MILSDECRCGNSSGSYGFDSDSACKTNCHGIMIKKTLVFIIKLFMNKYM
jgi:hypothetical protein